MSLNNFIPQVWSAQLLASLKKSLVFGQDGVVNRDYEGDISQYGDTVRINSVGAVTVGEYSTNGTLNLQQLDSTQQSLLIDEQKYFNFMIDDVDKAQTNPKVMQQAMIEAAYGLRDEADKYIASLYVNAANGIGGAGGVVVNKDNAYEYLVDLSVILDENNVPAGQRWVIVPAWVHGMLLKDDRFVATGSTNADDTLANGMVGKAAGFDILVSNNISKSTDSVPVYRAMAGYRGAISYAEQVSQVEAYRPENRFADAVKGLHLYGAKVVRPTGLAILNCKKS
jgi:hypothetical protein